MITEVRLVSFLRRYLPSSEHHLEGIKKDIPEGSTVAQLLDMLNLPEGSVKIVLLNGTYADGERIIRDGDVLHIIPPMAGG